MLCAAALGACGTPTDAPRPADPPPAERPPEKPPETPPGKRPDSVFVVGTLSGRVIGSAAQGFDPGTDAQLFAFGYFEGDSIARWLKYTVREPDGRYRVDVMERAGAPEPERRWRAVLVVEPLPGRGVGLTVAVSDWVTRRAGDTARVAVSLDATLSKPGVEPAPLPVLLADTLPPRPAPLDLSRLSDSARREGADVFVRLTGEPTPMTLAMLATAGLRLPRGHLEFATFWGGAGATVWARLPSDGEGGGGVLARLMALPFVTGVEPLATISDTARRPAEPFADGGPLGVPGHGRLVYDRNGICILESLDAPSGGGVAGAAPLACGQLIVGLERDVSAAHVSDLLRSVSAEIMRDSSYPADGYGSILVRIPAYTERAAYTALIGDPRLRYVSLNWIGRLIW